jgi:hypothetical protein
MNKSTGVLLAALGIGGAIAAILVLTKKAGSENPPDDGSGLQLEIYDDNGIRII